jgi:hypothetical protein
LLPIGFRDVDPPGWLGLPWLMSHDGSSQLSTRFGGLDDHLVDAWRVSSLVHLRHSANCEQHVRVTSKHELLEGSHLAVVALFGRPKDPLSKVADSTAGLSPIDGIPVDLSLSSVCSCLHLTCASVCVLHNVLWVVHQACVCALSGWVSPEPWLLWPYPAGYGACGGRCSPYLSAADLRFSGLPVPAEEFCLPCVGLTAGCPTDLNGVSMFRIGGDAIGVGASCSPGHRCPRPV